MPKRELYEPNHAYETPEPHAKPGYTGFFPDSGPKRNFQYGNVYEKWTHEIMLPHPVAGLRFGIMLNPNETLQRRLEDEVLAWKHETTTQNLRLRRNMMIGYTGYVPRKKFLCGKSYAEECKTATALFEKLKLEDQ